MIEIMCNDDTYTYNLYHLTKAFFPEEKIVQIKTEEADPVVSITLYQGKTFSIHKNELVELDTGKRRKRYVDKTVYGFYEKCTEHSLPWGLLTGIRPAKLAMQKRAEGLAEEEIAKWFQEELLVSKEKTALALEIAEKEHALLERLDYKEGYSLYVGIPFCPSVCTYCSFSSGSIEEWKEEINPYIEVLLKELSYIGKVSKEKKLNTIYIGGGTPTSLDEKQLERVLFHIKETFSSEHLLEYTVEAGRPDSITKEKLVILKKYGITRISINPQTMQQKTLNLIGRNHTVEEIIQVYEQARSLGFDNINMDIIAGLPKETLLDMEDTLQKIKKLGPDSLTVHALAIKRAAKFGQEKSNRGEIADLSDGLNIAYTMSEMIALSAQAAKEMGCEPYYLYRQKNMAGNFENVGYAKVDKAGIYNILIMEEVQSIIAAGAGACTKVVLSQPATVPGSKKLKKTALMRIENVKDIKAYIERIDEMIERKGEWLWH